jgi:hypothetical protein
MNKNIFVLDIFALLLGSSSTFTAEGRSIR